MGKKSGAAAADALAKILGVYLTTSAREKDKAIDQQRWQAQFELQRQQHQVQMQQAAREQAAYEKQQAEDRDVAGWLTALKGQGVTPPPEVNTQHELKSWLGMQDAIQEMTDKKRKSEQEAELAPARKRLLESQADYYANRGTTQKPPKNMRERIPAFMGAEYDSLSSDLKRLNDQFNFKKAELSSIDSMDPDAGTKKAAINQALQTLEGAQIGVYQRMKEIEDAVVKGGVSTPEEYDAYHAKLQANTRVSSEDPIEASMMEKQKTTSAQTPKSSENWASKLSSASKFINETAPKNEQGKPKTLGEMSSTDIISTAPRYAAAASIPALDTWLTAMDRVVQNPFNLIGNAIKPFMAPTPTHTIPGVGDVSLIDTSLNMDKVGSFFDLYGKTPKVRRPDSADSWYTPRTGTPFGRR